MAKEELLALGLSPDCRHECRVAYATATTCCAVGARAVGTRRGDGPSRGLASKADGAGWQRKIQSVRLTIRAGKFLALGELGAFSKAESRLSQGAPGGSVGSSALPGRNRPITGPLHTRSDS